MQVRFDGVLGFPGGLLDSTAEEPVKGLVRELAEELGLAESACSFTQSDHLVTHVCHQRQLVTHFYMKEISEQTYDDIERGVLNAHDWGEEVVIVSIIIIQQISFIRIKVLTLLFYYRIVTLTFGLSCRQWEFYECRCLR